MLSKTMGEWTISGKLQKKPYIFFQGFCLDMSTFSQLHPGGSQVLKKYYFKDMTNLIYTIFPHNRQKTSIILTQYRIGHIKQQNQVSNNIDSNGKRIRHRNQRLSLQNHNQISSKLYQFKKQLQKTTDRRKQYKNNQYMKLYIHKRNSSINSQKNSKQNSKQKDQKEKDKQLDKSISRFKIIQNQQKVTKENSSQNKINKNKTSRNYSEYNMAINMKNIQIQKQNHKQLKNKFDLNNNNKQKLKEQLNQQSATTRILIDSHKKLNTNQMKKQHHIIQQKQSKSKQLKKQQSQYLHLMQTGGDDIDTIIKIPVLAVKKNKFNLYEGKV